MFSVDDYQKEKPILSLRFLANKHKERIVSTSLAWAARTLSFLVSSVLIGNKIYPVLGKVFQY